VSDVTNLQLADLGRFDVFLDVGGFQGLSGTAAPRHGPRCHDAGQPWRHHVDAGLPTDALRFRRRIVSRADIEDALPDWRMISVEQARAAGLGWPLTKTAPQ